MNINSISPNLRALLPNEPGAAAQAVAGAAGGSFSDMLSSAFAVAAEADSVDKVSALELLTGRAEDMASLLLDAQKAELSLNLALQIRNKVLDAYDEIMRMQV